MRAAHASWVALLLTSGCLRFGYDVSRKRVSSPDASLADAGPPRAKDAAVAGATAYGAAAGSGAGGSSGGASGAAGLAAGSGGMAGSADGGAGAAGAAGSPPEPDPVLGATGLHVSDILGFYSGNWGDMLLRKQGDEIWGAYDFSSGSVVGQVTSEGVFVGWWTQSPTRVLLNAGEVEFRWSQMGGGTAIALDGRWRYGSSGVWIEDWDVFLVTDRDAPSSLTDRFNSPEDFVRHP